MTHLCRTSQIQAVKGQPAQLPVKHLNWECLGRSVHFSSTVTFKERACTALGHAAILLLAQEALARTLTTQTKHHAGTQRRWRAHVR